MALKLLIVDDEMLARARIKTLLNDCNKNNQETEIYTSTIIESASAFEALKLIKEQNFDGILLDINMPGFSGLEMARELNQTNPSTAIVFITAHNDYALNAFELSAVDYLTKPVRQERLEKALIKIQAHSKLNKLIEKEKEFISIQERNTTIRIELDEILYFKAEQKYVTVRTLDKEYLLNMSINELETKYPTNFVRCHRNTLVSHQAISAIEKCHSEAEGDYWVIRLHGISDTLIASRRQVPAVRALLKN